RNGLHVVIGTITKQGDDKDVDTGEEDRKKDQLAHTAELVRIGEIVAEIVQGKEPDLLLPFEKEKTEKNQNQTADEGGAKEHVNRSGDVGIVDMKEHIIKDRTEEKRRGGRHDHRPDQRHPAPGNSPGECTDN